MPDLDDFSALTDEHMLGDALVPAVVSDFAAGHSFELEWRNELGGLTFHVGDHYIKWNPRRSGIDLQRERERIEWLTGRHPAPRVVEYGSDHEAQWLITESLPGRCAVGDQWRARRPEAIRAIAEGLRAIHSVPIDDFPSGWAQEVWVGRVPESLGARPPIHDPVLVHGDACAPNTIISGTGVWVGNVDFGDLGVGDRWADLAIASLSLDWNFGEGHQEELFAAYKIEPDRKRIRYYRALWHQES